MFTSVLNYLLENLRDRDYKDLDSNELLIALAVTAQVGIVLRIGPEPCRGLW
jgi:uncharacterized protein (UPF0371 family)